MGTVISKEFIQFQNEKSKCEIDVSHKSKARFEMRENVENSRDLLGRIRKRIVGFKDIFFQDLVLLYIFVVVREKPYIDWEVE